MKCANEILEIRSNTNATYEANEKARLMTAYLIACADSVALCEGDISKALEKAANTYGGKKVSISFPIETRLDGLGNTLFQFVTEHKRCYANGESSWAPAGKKYSYEALEEYLTRFCYKTEIQKRTFARKCWGCGTRHYDTLVITATPACK